MGNCYTIYKIESIEEYNKFSNYLDDYLNFDIIDSSEDIYVSECGYNKDCQYYTYMQYKTFMGDKCIYIISLDDIIKKHQQICKDIEKLIKKLNKKRKEGLIDEWILKRLKKRSKNTIRITDICTCFHFLTAILLIASMYIKCRIRQNLTYSFQK